MSGRLADEGSARASTGDAPGDRLHVITDVARHGREPTLRALRAARAGGLAWILLREPGAGIDELLALLDALEPIFSRQGISLAVRPGAQLDARVALARDRGLRGLHVGGGDVDIVARMRGAPGASMRIGYSAHGVAEARLAFDAGASHVSLSPIFPPTSKPSSLPPLGLDTLRVAVSTCPGPIYALGGIDVANAADLARTGVAGLAVIGAVLGASDPGSATRALLGAFPER